MDWQILASVCSLMYAFQNVTVKVLTNRNVSSTLILWVMFAAAVPVLLPILYWTRPHVFNPNFPWILLLAVSCNLFAFYGYVRAIELTDISLVAPLLSLSPFFMLLTSWLIVSEVPDLQGLLGVFGVVIGTYFLAKGSYTEGLEPFRKLWEDPGARWAIIVSFVWSITANIDKLAVQASTPLGYSYWFHVVFSVAFFPVLMYRWSNSRSTFISGELSGDTLSKLTCWLITGILAVGVFQGFMSAAQMMALVETDVTYVIATKRAGMLVSVLAGGIVLGESQFRRRFFAAGLVLLGLWGIMFR